MSQSVERFNTSMVIMTLVLSSVSTLFVGLLISYIYLNVQSDLEAIPVPILFVINTIFLLGSSIALERSNALFYGQDHKKLDVALRAVVISTLLFFVFQIIAWNRMIALEKGIDSGINESFMYVLSGVHLLHVLAGVPFLLVHMYKKYRAQKDPLRSIEYFQDPKNKTTLRILGVYWHFLDVLWIILVLFLYINYWLRTM